MNKDDAIENLYTFINHFKDEIEHDGYGDKIFDTEQAQKDIETFKMSIQALSQEPCERFEWGIDGNVYKITKAKDGKEICQQVCKDAISRDAVLCKIKEVCFSKEWTQFRVNNGSHGQRDFIIDYIEKLPSVTQKSGHWIIDSWLWSCDKCGKTYHKDNARTFKFCPNCGARMDKE